MDLPASFVVYGDAVSYTHLDVYKRQVEGFAPEVAWVTQGGTEKLQERLAVRPTSETIFCTMYAKWEMCIRDSSPAACLQTAALARKAAEFCDNYLRRFSLAISAR